MDICAIPLKVFKSIMCFSDVCRVNQQVRITTGRLQDVIADVCKLYVLLTQFNLHFLSILLN